MSPVIDMKANSLIKEWNKLIKAKYKKPKSYDEAIDRINSFINQYPTLIITSACVMVVLMMFVREGQCLILTPSIAYPPFLWVVSLTPLPLVIYRVMLTKEYNVEQVTTRVEEDQVIVGCGVIGALIAYSVHALGILFGSMFLFSALILLVGSFHKK